MNGSLILTLLWVVAASPAAFGEASNPAQPACSVRVLFLGNSYTYFNNLPELLTTLAKAGHQCSVATRMIAPGGFRLKDHWDDLKTRAVLDNEHWDYVVLQDQSSLGLNYYLDGIPRVAGDELFLPYAKKWIEEIERRGAKPILYLTWNRKPVPDDQAQLSYAYFHASVGTSAVVAPVGIAWQGVHEQASSIELYYKDGSHPSQAGSYLAACTFYAALFHQSPEGLPSDIAGTPIDLEKELPKEGETAVLVDIPKGDAAVLQKAAWNAWQSSKAIDPKKVHAPAIPAPILAPGAAVTDLNLAGTWRGELLFYPGVGPVKMTLQLHATGALWSGHLEIDYANNAFPKESFDLKDLKVSEREIRFSDASSAGVKNWRIDFLAHINGRKIKGSARTEHTEDDGTRITVLGDWELQRD